MQIRPHIPNLITLGNLWCGSLSIIYAFRADIWMSCLLFGISLVLDFLDGFLARRLDVHSEIGKQLDSFADLISFGLFPGLLMYLHVQKELAPGTWEYLPFIALLLPLFSAIRLARFNLSAPSSSFRGLPTPANALLILSYVCIPIYHSKAIMATWMLSPYILVILTGISCFLLVSPISLFSLKFTDFTFPNNWYRYLLLLLGGLGILFFHFLAIPFIILFYLLLSLWLNP